MEDNLKDVYAVIWGQRSTSVQSKVKQLDEYGDNNVKGDCAWLLNQMKDVMFKFEGHKKVMAMVNVRIPLDRYRQHERKSNAVFF